MAEPLRQQLVRYLRDQFPQARLVDHQFAADNILGLIKNRTDEAVVAAAEALSDSLTMLGVNPDEVPEHGGWPTGKVLAGIAVKATMTTTLGVR